MKKILSFVFAAAFTISAYSQTLMTDNFESYTVGNLGTQGGWNRDGGGATSAKIATVDAAHGKSLQMATTATTGNMWIYKQFNWGGAAAGNDLFVAEFDMYTGSSVAEVQVYESDGTNYYAIFDVYLSPTSGAYLADQADFDASSNGEHLMDGITANTWYKVKVTYNTLEGTMNVSINGTNFGPFQKEASHYPTEFDVVTSGANSSAYDNIVMSAQSSLAVSNASKAKLSVYPNPATDIVNISADKKVSNITFFDVSGRKVKQSTENTINVQDIAKGTYIVDIKFVDGTSDSKKVIKK